MMSEKFGLDWMEYDNQRILDLMLVENIIQSKSNHDKPPTK
jgi:hypothetical protein